MHKKGMQTAIQQIGAFEKRVACESLNGAYLCRVSTLLNSNTRPLASHHAATDFMRRRARLAQSATRARRRRLLKNSRGVGCAFLKLKCGILCADSRHGAVAGSQHAWFGGRNFSWGDRRPPQHTYCHTQPMNKRVKIGSIKTESQERARPLASRGLGAVGQTLLSLKKNLVQVGSLLGLG
jgi:hypothetical protein